nr:reverse transcriptase domain-containing protein [Amycolatopsis niigatensis]
MLEPIFAAAFKPCSYGFRPNRRAQDAVAEIHYCASKPRNCHWVLEADIHACFDEKSHPALMDRLRARITDKRICSLVKAFLKAGVLTELGKREETLTGTPQGGILSPLLANIALSAVDDHLDRQRRAMGSRYQRAKFKAAVHGVCGLIRYADDFVLMVWGERHHAEALREGVSAMLAPLGLRLSPDKTRVVRLDAGFASLVTLALNVADPVVAGECGKATFDPVGPLLSAGNSLAASEAMTGRPRGSPPAASGKPMA